MAGQAVKKWANLYGKQTARARAEHHDWLSPRPAPSLCAPALDGTARPVSVSVEAARERAAGSKVCARIDLEHVDAVWPVAWCSAIQ